MTPTQRLAGMLLGEPVDDWIARQRAEGKGWRTIAADLRERTNGQVDVSHEKIHARDGVGGGDSPVHPKIDCFTRTISVEGELTDELAEKLVEIAGKCPVHRTLENGSAVRTEVRRTPA